MCEGDDPAAGERWCEQLRIPGRRRCGKRTLGVLHDQVLIDQDALLISLLAYAGLRPQEALALTWNDIRDNTIIVDKAVTHGVLKSTKTNKNHWVALLKPLADDLNSYRKTLKPTPGPSALIFPHPDDPTDRWGDTTYRNWRDRSFAPAATAPASLPPPTPSATPSSASCSPQANAAPKSQNKPATHSPSWKTPTPTSSRNTAAQRSPTSAKPSSTPAHKPPAQTPRRRQPTISEQQLTRVAATPKLVNPMTHAVNSTDPETGCDPCVTHKANPADRNNQTPANPHES